MNFKKKPKAIRLLTGALTLCVVFGAVFLGVYPAAVSAQTLNDPFQKREPTDRKDDLPAQAGETDTYSEITGVAYMTESEVAELFGDIGHSGDQ